MKTLSLIVVCLIMSACAKSNDSVSSTSPLSGEYIMYSASTCDTTKIALVYDFTIDGKSIGQGYQYSGTGCTGDRTKYGIEVVSEYRIVLQSGSNFIIEYQKDPKTYAAMKIVSHGLQNKVFSTYDESLAFLGKDWSAEAVTDLTRIK